MSAWSDKANADELLDLLAGLIASHGAERFLAAELVLESPRCFPDAWEPTIVGVGRILHRLLYYTGLEGWRMELVDGRAPMQEPGKLEQPRIDFLSAENDHLLFQLERVGVPEWVPAALCFEAARAFVAVREPRHPYRDGDQAEAVSQRAQARAAVATVYLGFGLITTNAAHGFASHGEIVGQSTVTWRAHLKLGALPAGDLCFLLAVQLALRGCSLEAADPLLRQLARDQADEARQWLERLAGAEAELRERLGIGADVRPQPAPLPRVTELPESAVAELRAAEERHERPNTA